MLYNCTYEDRGAVLAVDGRSTWQCRGRYNGRFVLRSGPSVSLIKYYCIKNLVCPKSSFFICLVVLNRVTVNIKIPSLASCGVSIIVPIGPNECPISRRCYAKAEFVLP